MAYFKLTKGTYSEESDVIRALLYIFDVIKCKHDIYGGCNIIAYNSFEPELIAEQFFAIQYRRRFTRRIYHVVISFDQILDAPDLKFAYQVGVAVSHLYADYQSVFAVHEDKGYLHIHMIFNNCAIFSEVPNLSAIFDICRIQQMVDDMISGHLGIPRSAYSIFYKNSHE